MSSSPKWPQLAVGVGALVLGIAMAVGALTIPAHAGYAGVGPNFLPWVVALALAACGAALVYEAASGGFRGLEEPSGGATADWLPALWVVCGALSNAALLSTVGFISSCTLCFVLAVRGLRLAEGRAGGDLSATLRDILIGLCISAPAFWLFTKGLGINLPGLTASGWL